MHYQVVKDKYWSFFLKSSQIIYHHQGNSIKIMEVFNSKKEILCLANMLVQYKIGKKH